MKNNDHGPGPQSANPKPQIMALSPRAQTLGRNSLRVNHLPSFLYPTPRQPYSPVKPSQSEIFFNFCSPSLLFLQSLVVYRSFGSKPKVSPQMAGQLHYFDALPAEDASVGRPFVALASAGIFPGSYCRHQTSRFISVPSFFCFSGMSVVTHETNNNLWNLS